MEKYKFFGSNFETLEAYIASNYYIRKVEVARMAKEVDVKKIVSNLSKLGVPVTMTKSRVEMLKTLAPPAQNAHTQS